MTAQNLPSHFSPFLLLNHTVFYLILILIYSLSLSLRHFKHMYSIASLRLFFSQILSRYCLALHGRLPLPMVCHFYKGLPFNLGTSVESELRKIPCRVQTLLLIASSIGFTSMRLTFIISFTSCQDINLITKFKTCHNLWLWLPIGDFTPPPECQERYTESPEQMQESSLKFPILQKPRSSYPCAECQRSNPQARFL